MKELSEYERTPAEELTRRIQKIREEERGRLVIMAHYYAPDEVVALADEIGDSLALAKKAAASTAEAVLFCGVKFMLETADILMNTPEKLAQRNGKRAIVMAPDPTAGCPMADMITSQQADDWKRQLETVVDFSEFTPVTYVNSSVETKAFCGRHGGSVCTSANAEKALRDAFAKRPKALFMPDSRLGRTTALALGVPENEIALWKPGERLGGLEPDALRAAKVVLWDGCCPIHQRFSPDVVRRLRAEYPGVKVWVHPEAPREFVELCDGYGSTTKLLQVVADAEPGSTLAIGTEWKLVDRMKRTNPDRTVLYPGEEPSICEDMSKSTLAKAAFVLDRWREGNPVNVTTAPDDAVADAYRALESLL